MNWRLIVVLLIGISLTTVACDDDEGTVSNDGLSFSGSNGFAIKGDGLSDVTVNTTNNSGETTVASASGLTIHGVSVDLEGEYDGNDANISISYSSQTGAPGTGEKQVGISSSGSLSISVNINSTLYRGNLSFANGSGSVNFTNVGDRLQGTFKATLKSGSKEVEVVGKFDVENQRD